MKTNEVYVEYYLTVCQTLQVCGMGFFLFIWSVQFLCVIYDQTIWFKRASFEKRFKLLQYHNLTIVEYNKIYNTFGLEGDWCVFIAYINS